MFDADKGNHKVEREIDGLTDEFAALFRDLSLRKRRELITKMNQMMSEPDSVDAFVAGTYAQDSSGQPARPLGSGSGQSDTDELNAAWTLILGKLPQPQRAAILRITTPTDPAFIDVETDGTPKELVTSRQEVKTQKDRADKAERELADAKDESKDGSLAKQLKDAKATPGSLDETKFRKALDDALQAVDQIHGSVTGVKGKDEAKAKIGAVGKAAGLKPKTTS